MCIWQRSPLGYCDCQSHCSAIGLQTVGNSNRIHRNISHPGLRKLKFNHSHSTPIPEEGKNYSLTGEKKDPVGALKVSLARPILPWKEKRTFQVCTSV